MLQITIETGNAAPDETWPHPVPRTIPRTRGHGTWKHGPSPVSLSAALPRKGEVRRRTPPHPSSMFYQGQSTSIVT